jgi:hypothetical protein
MVKEITLSNAIIAMLYFQWGVNIAQNVVTPSLKTSQTQRIREVSALIVMQNLMLILIFVKSAEQKPKKSSMNVK